MRQSIREIVLPVVVYSPSADDNATAALACLLYLRRDSHTYLPAQTTL